VLFENGVITSERAKKRPGENRDEREVAAQRRTWFFLDLASYEGVLRGAVRPGFIATLLEGGDPGPTNRPGRAAAG
jgi:hypothetical protein